MHPDEIEETGDVTYEGLPKDTAKLMKRIIGEIDLASQLAYYVQDRVPVSSAEELLDVLRLLSRDLTHARVKVNRLFNSLAKEKVLSEEG